MGCIQSAPAVKEDAPQAKSNPAAASAPLANSAAGGNAAAAPAANGGSQPVGKVQMQRRRLSVAPQHVGSIDYDGAQGGNDNDDEADAQADGEQFYSTSARSKKGYVPYNSRKQNQDAFIVRERLKGDANLSVYGVFDGHGEFGELISGFCRDKLPEFLEAEVNLSTDPVNSLLRATANLCTALTKTNINRQFSGTTAVYGLRVGRKIFVANIGDSRGIMVRKGPNGSLEVVALSNDHKPDNPKEKERIIKAGGRVQPLPGLPDEDCGPPRVWLGDIDVPGLAMSRSIGDEVSHSVGVVDIPEIIEYDITDNDLFAVWASDGVWEFLSNEQVAKIVHSQAPNSAGANWEAAVNALIEAANKQWRKEEEVVDDITTVIFGINQF